MTEATGPGAAKRLGMVVDLNRCMGCWTCAVACKAENNVGAGLFWLRVLTIGGSDHIDVPAGTFPAVAMAYQPTGCFHCDNAPCVKACPVGATYRRDDGIVMIDYDKCIGCRYCMIACPYNNRVFNWHAPVQDPSADTVAVGTQPARPKGVVEKCTFCYHRVDQGLEPRCVVACPAGARFFGDLADPTSEVATLVRTKPTYRVFEEKGTEPSVYFITRAGVETEGVEE
ncbi:MAG: sulfate reduction electron transfer complex DsrMKJOP subunit DsrO [Candidatus Limnocylindrales bacterium]